MNRTGEARLPGEGESPLLQSLIVMDQQGVVVSVGVMVTSLFGLDREKLVGERISSLIPSIDWAEIVERLDASPGHCFSEAFPIERRNGEELDVDLSFFEYSDGETKRILSLVLDSRGGRDRTTMEGLEEENRRLFDRNIAGVYRARPDGTIFDCNDAFAMILGFNDREDYLERSTSSPFMDSSELDGIVEKLRKGHGLSRVETGMIRGDGSPVLVSQNVSLIAGDDGDYLEASMVDITQRRLAEKQVEYQTHHDGLTGLANAVLFEQKVADALANAQRFERIAALFLIDLDEFKNVNDTMGYNVGNQLIQLAGYRLQKALREVDTVARPGGDEFTVILQSLADAEDAVRVAEKLRSEIARPFLIDGHEIFVTSATGIAIYPEDGDSHETLMRNADIAMYRAKELGRNEIQVCSRARTIEAIERMTLENDLRQAIERNEFVLHFQPQIDAADRKAHALEALIRWNHPTRGLVMPSEFIPLAERSRLMVEIGRWVLMEACLTAARWQDVHPPVRIAINVSPRQFQDRSFLDHVRASLEISKLNPVQLELEITEGVAMQNPEAALGLLQTLKEMGVRISIDDFGTGYSSLSYLTKFPIDCLKIDQGFVQDIGKSGSQSAIIAAVIALAHQLELHVIAEGVETPEQSDFLIGQRCESLQGFYYSRPQPLAAIDKMIRG